MANGILDLNTDENQQDDNLFLSAPEQRGLEAATYATAIGQAPATGSIFGDIFSTLAQTGPAALSTFKERQSIKEKEAEYKSKLNTNLAAKIKGQFVYDTQHRNPPTLDKNGNQVEQPPGANVYVLNTELAKYQGTDRYQPKKTEPTALNITKYVITERRPKEGGGFTYVKDVLKRPYEDYAKARVQAENDPDIEVTLYEEPKNYYDTKTNTTVSMTPLKAAQANENEKNRYLYKPPEQIAAETTLNLARDKELIAGQDKIRKEYYSASELADVYMNIVDDLQEIEANGSGVGTGTIGNFIITLDNISGGVNEVFKSISSKDDNFDANYEEAALAVEDLIKNEKGTNNSIAQYLSVSEKDTNMAQRSQTVKSMLTQFVYAVAKSRESGGKFSVSDIDFAFMSAGKGGNPQNILRGMSAVIKPILKNKIKLAKAYFKNKDNSTMTDLQLWQHENLGQAQNVLRVYYGLSGRLIPEEWNAFDNDPEGAFKDKSKDAKIKRLNQFEKMKKKMFDNRPKKNKKDDQWQILKTLKI